MKRDNESTDEEGWEYGDVWKQGSPDEPASAEDIAYVEVLRGDTGSGYDDSLMLNLVAYLGLKGIRATMIPFPSVWSPQQSRLMFSRLNREKRKRL
jgi:hypothetical protein